ncbi:unnamed protein product [Heligmosomoides polygyrus]|uniref:Helo_like_N domain-containing protein n=1 Tax=Heligmosomoides polygyrus TaxID=6339 RepID=A0A183GSA2_HELPZ|nr:unnamed protein product [Heligmosomoides polygyrus]
MRKNTKRTSGVDAEDGMPLWASKLIERFDLYSCSLQSAVTDAFERVFRQIQSIQSTQDAIVARLADLEAKLDHPRQTALDRSALYSTIVKVKADSQRIEEKSMRIAWVGIDEQANEESTRRFDREILKEVVHTSGDEQLIREFEQGRITSHRHPAGKPRRIIKISLPSQALRDALLDHMRSGRQSLTQRFVHFFARRDYTAEELSVDRSLRKEAGDLNAREGKLAYVVRDFNIVKLKVPRELPRRPITLSSIQTSRSSDELSGTRSRTRGRAGRVQHIPSSSA